MPQKNQATNLKRQSVARDDKVFRERLRDRYKPTDFVRVMNIDNEAFEWQYFPIDGEEFSMGQDRITKIISGRASFDSNYQHVVPGAEQIWEMGAGETEVLVGANADLFIEGLYKKLVAKKRTKDFMGTDDLSVLDRTDYRSKPEVNFNWNDGLTQEQLIDKIFLGVVDPNFDFKKEDSSDTDRSQSSAKK